MTYDRDDGLVFVANKNDGSITVIAADTGKVAATIKVADDTGNVAYDPSTRSVYAAARTPDALVAIDPTTRTITRRVAVDQATHPRLLPLARHRRSSRAPRHAASGLTFVVRRHWPGPRSAPRGRVAVRA